MLKARAVQLLAEHLLDTNFSRLQGSSGGGGDEYQANLQHNLSDAIALLPKLTTGIDVNVRFDHIRSLEYTAEAAVFDLLSIDLVHGWLYDPQDADTAAAIASRSYNELVLLIVAALGQDATPLTLSPQVSRRFTPPPDSRVGSVGPPAPPAPSNAQEAHKISAATLSAALENTLRITIPEGPTAGGDLRSMSTSDSAQSQDSVTSAISRMLSDTVKDAFKTPTPTPGGTSFRRMSLEAAERKGSSTLGSASAQEGAVAPPAAPAVPSGSGNTSGVTIDSLLEGAAPSEPAGPPPEPQTAAAVAPTPPPQGAPARDAAAVHDALCAQQFLETNPSQLTVYGLASLAEQLAEGQLAVFFRNNHFNVLLKKNNGLHILVTDQGYLYEGDVVWEHLSNVDGDTQLLTWDLQPFSAHAGSVQAPHETALLGGGDANPDADMALAMQLQAEEEERARVAEERRRAHAAAAGRQLTGPSNGERSGEQQRPGKKPGKKKKDSKICAIM